MIIQVNIEGYRKDFPVKATDMGNGLAIIPADQLAFIAPPEEMARFPSDVNLHVFRTQYHRTNRGTVRISKQVADNLDTFTENMGIDKRCRRSYPIDVLEYLPHNRVRVSCRDWAKATATRESLYSGETMVLGPDMIQPY